MSSVDPREASKVAQFDAYARSYSDEVNRSLAFLGGVKVDYFTKVKAEYLVDLLSEHFDDPGDVSLLDIGCGTGTLHPLIVDRLRAVSGTDVSAASIAEAARLSPAVNYRAYDGERLPYDDGSFDAAVAVCVMHHVPLTQWPAFVAELKRILRPGGLGLVFEHNPRNPLTRRVVSNCEFDADAVLLSQHTTRALLTSAGFADVSSRAILSLPSFGKATRALDRASGIATLGAQYFARGVA